MSDVTLHKSNIHERVKDYYRGERISNALLFFIGIAAISCTLLLYIWRQGQLSTGLFFSSVPLAIFFITTSLYRFARTFKRYPSIQDSRHGQGYLIHNEYPHLQERGERFTRKRKVDFIGLFLGVIICTIGVFSSWNHILLGTSISVTIFSALLLVFDLFGQFRTLELLHHISKFAEQT